MIDFFVTNQVFVLSPHDNDQATFIVPSYLVQCCIDYVNNLLVVKNLDSEPEQISLTPFDLVHDEQGIDVNRGRIYNWNKTKYAIKNSEKELTDIELAVLDRFGWSYFNNFRSFIIEDWFLDNVSIVNNMRDKKTIYPAKEDIFKAFKVTNFDFVKVVCLGQDPYPNVSKKNIPYANGIAFATNTEDKPVSLQIIEKAIKKEMSYPDDFVLQNDLIHLIKQGVLLLNSSLTVEKGKPGSHEQYWTRFIKEIILAFSKREKPVIFMLLGSVAKGFQPCIDSRRHSILTASHPASAAYTNSVWDSKGIFKKASDLSNEYFSKGIKWII